MGLARSTYYDTPATEANTEIVARITAICEEFEAYGYRRVGAELRHQGIVVNGKKIRRLMRQHDLQPKRRRRFIATTDSDHDSPIFSNRAKDVTADRPNQLWVADITYVAIAVGFVYAAVILDAWSRRVVGYAISRSIDTRLTLAALKAAVRSRQPPPDSALSEWFEQRTAGARGRIRRVMIVALARKLLIALRRDDLRSTHEKLFAANKGDGERRAERVASRPRVRAALRGVAGQPRSDPAGRQPRDRIRSRRDGAGGSRPLEGGAVADRRRRTHTIRHTAGTD